MKVKDIRTHFGARLRQLRTDKGLSQEQLMMNTGIHRTYISEVERGIRNISLLNIEKLANALQIDIREFFDFGA